MFRFLFKISSVSLIFSVLVNFLPVFNGGDGMFLMDVKARDNAGYFISNLGQVNDEVKFYVNFNDASVFVGKDGVISYKFFDKVVREKFSDFDLDFVGKDRSDVKFNIFKGEDRFSDIPVFYDVFSADVFDGVDVGLRVNGGAVEKLFYVHPFADVGDIRVRVVGGELRVDDDGNLLVGDSVVGNVPKAFQDGKKIDVSYEIFSNGEYGFKVGEYDHSKELLIDPLLASTYLGGVNDEYSSSKSYDLNNSVVANGSLYVVGVTYSSDFPTTSGAYDTSFNSGNYSDVFVSKFSVDLGTLEASTFIGGSDNEDMPTITVDGNGNVFVALRTYSSDFPTTSGAYDTSFNGGNGYSDVALVKLSSDLSTLSASTFLGGTKDDYPSSIAINSSNEVYVAGEVENNGDFPVTSGVVDSSSRSSGIDTFISKFSNDLSATGFVSTFFYTGMHNPTITIGPTASENLFITGRTTNSTIGGAGNYQSSLNGNSDNFVASLNPALSVLNDFSYFGGSEDASLYKTDISTDGTSIIIAGNVDAPSSFYSDVSSNANTSNFYLFTPDGTISSVSSGVYLAKFDTGLDTATVSLLGGDGSTYLGGIVVNSDNDVVVSTQSTSSNFPTTSGAYDETDPDSTYADFTVSRVSSDFSSLSASTYFGGSNVEYYSSLALDASNNIYFVGFSKSSDLAVTSGAYQSSLGGSDDVFIAKFSNDLSANAPNPIVDLSGVGGDESVVLSWTEPDGNGAPVKSYKVEYRKEGASSWSECSTSSCTDSTAGATVSNLDNWSDYEFRVYAINDSGTSGASNVVTAVPVPCGAMSDNDDSSGNTVSTGCFGASVVAGDIYFQNIPDSFSFPQKFYSDQGQDSFSNDDASTKGVLDVASDPSDVLTVADLRGYGDFEVQLTASTDFSDGVHTIPLHNLYVVSECPDADDLDSALYGSPSNCSSSTGVEFADGGVGQGNMDMSLVPFTENGNGSSLSALRSAYTSDGKSFDANSDGVSDVITLMDSTDAKVGMLSEALGFYLDIPAGQEAGSYSVVLTLDLVVGGGGGEL